MESNVRRDYSASRPTPPTRDDVSADRNGRPTKYRPGSASTTPRSCLGQPASSKTGRSIHPNSARSRYSRSRSTRSHSRPLPVDTAAVPPFLARAEPKTADVDYIPRPRCRRTSPKWVANKLRSSHDDDPRPGPRRLREGRTEAVTSGNAPSKGRSTTARHGSLRSALRIGEVHIDDGRSAWNPPVRRQAGDRLMARLENGASRWR